LRMKRIIYTLVTVTLIVASSCESENATLVRCFPDRMSANIIGGVTGNLTADFHYVPDSELLDHITWSDKKTHYFEYDDFGNLTLVRLKRIDYKVQEEQWFSYEGNKIIRVDECVKRLDIIYLDPIEGDSSYTGHREFEYSGNNITLEKIYQVEKNKKETLVIENAYEYDGNGNIIRSVLTDIEAKSEETTALSYHQSKHPYSQINMVFTGETYINNVLSRTEQTDNLEYTYEIVFDNNKYPSEVIEKTNGRVSRVTRYTYFCK